MKEYRRTVYLNLLMSGRLNQHLAQIEEAAESRVETSEKLKEENQMEWVRRMNNLENRAEEIVKAELIHTFERR